MKKIKWTFEACKAEALKYTHRRSFKINSGSAYTRARENKWLDEICIHMTPKQKPNGYWTLEKCRIEALKYSTVKEYRKNSGGSYNTAYQNKWLKEVCSHMRMCKPNNYWTKEVCKQETLKYTDYEAFNKNSSGAVGASRAGGWFEEITSHFKVKGNRHKRFIYAYEFPDNHVYVGLTYNIAKRKNQHIKTGTVFEYSEETNSIPAFKQLTRNPVSVEEAKLLEESYLQEYIKDGWAGLNKAKTGGLGGGKSKWTFDKIYKEALKYKDRSSFYKDFSWAYSVAIRRGWIEEITKHMAYKQKPAYYWNYENCRIEALKYTSKKEFNKTCTSAYQSAKRNGWLEDLCDHMKIKQELKEILKIK